MTTSQPASIKWFSRLVLFNIALGLTGTLLNMPLYVITLRSKPKLSWLNEHTALGLVAVTTAFGLAIQLVLWFFITRKGSKLAVTIWIAIFLIRLLTIFGRMVNVPTGIALITFALGLVMISLLALPDSRSWFARRSTIIDARTFD